MVNTIRGKVSNYFQSLAQILHLNLKRTFYTIILILALVPLAYALFLMLNATKEGLSLTDIMRQRPTIAILSIVAGLDIMCGYSLWMIREQVLADRRLYRIILIGILITQLLVNNLLVAGAAIAGLMFSGQVQNNNADMHKGKVIVPICLLTIGYVFCMAMMVAVMTR